MGEDGSGCVEDRWKNVEESRAAVGYPQRESAKLFADKKPGWTVRKRYVSRSGANLGYVSQAGDDFLRVLGRFRLTSICWGGRRRDVCLGIVQSLGHFRSLFFRASADLGQCPCWYRSHHCKIRKI